MELINNPLNYTKNFPSAREFEYLIQNYSTNFIISFLENNNFEFVYRDFFSYNFLENDSDIGRSGCIFSQSSKGDTIFFDQFLNFKVYATEQKIIDSFMRYIKLELYV